MSLDSALMPSPPLLRSAHEPGERSGAAGVRRSRLGDEDFMSCRVSEGGGKVSQRADYKTNTASVHVSSDLGLN